MCLHFHPMAVSRWFSAASLKQVSNMAITGSGSLAVSLSLFVISLAFLPKGKFFYFLKECSPFSLLFCVSACACACVCYAESPPTHTHPQLKPEEHRGEVVVLLRAGCAPASPWNLSITFVVLLCLPGLWGQLVPACSASLTGVLSWVLLQSPTRCEKKVRVLSRWHMWRESVLVLGMGNRRAVFGSGGKLEAMLAWKPGSLFWNEPDPRNAGSALASFSQTALKLHSANSPRGLKPPKVCASGALWRKKHALQSLPVSSGRTTAACDACVCVCVCVRVCVPVRSLHFSYWALERM